MTKFTVFLLIINSYSIGFAKVKHQKVKVQNWNFKIPSNSVISQNPLQRAMTANIINDDAQAILISRDHHPVGIKAIKKIMRTMKGKSLKIHKRKKYAIFSFKTSPEQKHFFSTRGGYLQVNLYHEKKGDIVADISKNLRYQL